MACTVRTGLASILSQCAPAASVLGGLQELARWLCSRPVLDLAVTAASSSCCSVVTCEFNHPYESVAASQAVTPVFLSLSYYVTTSNRLANMNSPVITKHLTFDNFPKNDLRRKRRRKRKEGRHHYTECSPAAVRAFLFWGIYPVLGVCALCPGTCSVCVLGTRSCYIALADLELGS